MKTPQEISAAIAPLINAPWAADGRNCWRLAREIVALFGYELPAVVDVAPDGSVTGIKLKRRLFEEHPERKKWVQVKRPGLWALACMQMTDAPDLGVQHYGVWLQIDGGRILHSELKQGVQFENLQRIALRKWTPIFLVPRHDAAPLSRPVQPATA